MDLDDLIAIQTKGELRDHHLVYIGDDKFCLAHTDEERAATDKIPLADCELHRWLSGLDGPPVSPGTYIAYPHEPDAYSEPYGADRWDFVSLSIIAL